jgi:hypothetical protein
LVGHDDLQTEVQTVGKGGVDTATYDKFYQVGKRPLLGHLIKPAFPI